MIRILDIDPATIKTAQQKGERVIFSGGRGIVVHYVKKSVKESMERMERAIRREFAGVHFDRGTPVAVRVVFFYHTDRKKLFGTFKGSRSDIDNLVKGLFDSITKAGIWDDDAQAQIIEASKMYVDEGMHRNPCIELSLYDANRMLVRQ